jgi:hypothetical protein
MKSDSFGMTKRELSDVMYALDVPPSYWHIDGSSGQGGTVLAERDGRWVVFLSEHGDESGSRWFDDERIACAYYLGLICARLAAAGYKLRSEAA